MNNKNVNPVYAGVVIGVAGFITKKCISTVVRKRKTKKEVDNMSPEVKAIFVATGRMVKRINRGEYLGKTEDDIVTDFQFEKIIALNQE